MSHSAGTKRKRQVVARRKQEQSSGVISHHVIKRCLLDMLSPLHASQTISDIQHDTLRQCKISLLTSRLMHMYLVDIFETDPTSQIIVTQNLIKQAICTVTTCTQKKKILIPSRMLDIFTSVFSENIFLSQYDGIIVSRDNMSKTNLQYLASTMYTNFITSLEVNFEQRTKSWIRIQLYNAQHQPTYSVVSTLYQLCTRQIQLNDVPPNIHILIQPHLTNIVAKFQEQFPANFNVNSLKKYTSELLRWAYQVLHDIEQYNDQDPPPVRKFHQYTLFPMSRWTLGHITYDITKLQSLSLRILYDKNWKQLFRWKPSYNDTQQRQFLNLTTDGVSVSLVFAKTTFYKRSDHMTVNELSSYVQQLSSGPDHMYKHIIGIDTGRINFFVASIRKNVSHHQRPSTLHQDETIKMSNARWKYLRGTSAQNKQVATWIRQRPDINTIQSQFPTIKSSSGIQSMVHIEYMLQHFIPMIDYYTAKRFTRLKMTAYINTQKAWNDVIKQLELSVGGKDQIPHTVVVIGNPTFSHASHGYASTPVKSLYTKLKSQTLFQVTEVDEYKTSQICSRCHHMVVPWDRGKGIIPHAQIIRKKDQRWRQYPWSVRVCSNKLCRTHWNRDTNAARNMVYIHQHMTYYTVRPQLFTPPHRNPIASSSTTLSVVRTSRRSASLSQPRKKQRRAPTSTSTVSRTSASAQSDWICPFPTCQRLNPSSTLHCENCFLERQ